MGVATTTGKGRGGRGARERILQAAEELFYTRGIHATGVAALMKAAHVSPRTFYAHFDSKNLLVAEYLRRLESETRVPAEAALESQIPPHVQDGQVEAYRMATAVAYGR